MIAYRTGRVYGMHGTAVRHEFDRSLFPKGRPAVSPGKLMGNADPGKKPFTDGNETEWIDNRDLISIDRKSCLEIRDPKWD